MDQVNAPIEPSLIRVVDCPEVRIVTPPDWDGVERVFMNSKPVEFHQFWNEQQDQKFCGGEVRAGRCANGLWVYAALNDRDIFNDTSDRNSFFYQSGDVFEVFVKPELQDAYFEFHVGPANQQLQMRIPSASDFSNESTRDFASWKIDAPLLQSWTHVEPWMQRWRVLVFLPIAEIVEHPGQPQHWRISFSRYDYTRGDLRPVLSSTSPHKMPAFHRQAEWFRIDPTIANPKS